MPVLYTEGLVGEFSHTIDNKNRLSIPSKFRSVLGDHFVISKGVERCLIIYTLEEWDAFQSRLAELNNFDQDARAIKRFFGSGSAYVDIDPHGRILIPAPLKEYAGLTRDVTIVGDTGGRGEIWDSDAWNAAASEEDASVLTKNLMAKGFKG
ncbi:MAG: division/cell wall cluster transcriptional repressor MraZ [Lachnospiraceae bacterium]|nr:division/cell wall cluster transcriptional repressor MraZ [Lachnospiraceae bacterium]